MLNDNSIIIIIIFMRKQEIRLEMFFFSIAYMNKIFLKAFWGVKGQNSSNFDLNIYKMNALFQTTNGFNFQIVNSLI